MELLGSRYEILRRVSNREGHEVLKAIDRELDLVVALKTYRTDGTVQRDELLAEAQLLISLPPHPGLPLARFSFFEDGRFVLVMDWIDGTDLAVQLREHGDPGLTIANVVDVVSKAAAALDHLHRQTPPIVHGDVKPSNLIQRPDAGVVLVDFGIAVLAGRAGHSGSRGYIAPEVAASAPLTPAADVYGLAATAVALLTGVPPDARPSMFETIESAELAEFSLCLRSALATDPRRRPPSAGELAQRLREAAIGGLPSGVVTMLSAEIADASSLWESSDDVMPAIRERVREVVGDAVQSNGGRPLTALGDGDTTWSVFRDPSSAVVAAQLLQRRVDREAWAGRLPIGLRVAVDTGSADLREGHYQGPIVNRVARLRAIAPAGRIVVSDAIAALVRDSLPSGTTLCNLGRCDIRGLAAPETLYGVVDPGTEPFVIDPKAGRPGNLREPLTQFIGRKRELDDLARLVAGNRVCTLTGTSAVGKSRLATAVATHMGTLCPDGVWLVDFGPVTRDDQVAGAVANALDVTEGGAGTYAAPSRAPDRSNEDRLIDRLARQRAALVFDNHERVSKGCAALISTLLRSCAELRILTTGHEPLGVEAEVVYHVGPMDIPPADAAIDELVSCDAVQLFIDRARFHDQHLPTDDDAVKSIAAISRRLEGIPLSIEMAASWTGVLSVAQIRDLPFDPALDEPRALDALEWSYEQLSEPQRATLRRLSVFAASFGLDAASAVCCAPPLTQVDLPALLATLADKSLLEIAPVGQHKRYRLLSATRRVAEARLLVSGDQPAAFAAHRAYYVALAHRPALNAPVTRAWLDLVEGERPDLRRAFESAQVESRGDDLRLAAALTPFWLIRGHLSEGIAWLEEATTKSAGTPSITPTVRAGALSSAALLACFAGDIRRAGIAGRQALAIGQTAGERHVVASATAVLALVAAGEGRIDEAERRGRDALTAAKDVNDRRLAAFVLANLGNVLLARGAVAEARARYDESLAMRRADNDLYGLTWTLFRLGLLTAWEGRLDRGRDMLEEALRDSEELAYPQGRLLALLGLGEIASVSGDREAADGWFVEALVVARVLGETASEAIALTGLADAATAAGDLATTSARLREAEDCRLEDNLPALASVLRSRGLVAAASGEFAIAAQYHRAALLVRRRLRDSKAMVDELESLAPCLLDLGEEVDSSTLLSAASRARREMGLPRPRNEGAGTVADVEADGLTLDGAVGVALNSALSS